MSYSDYLAQYDEDYDAAEVKDSNYDTLPDGKYQARIDSVRIEESRKDNTPYLAWDLIVMSGANAGRHIFRRNGFDPNQLDFLKKDLTTCGLNIRLSQLESALPDLLDLIVDVQLKTGKPGPNGQVYQNCYINRVAHAPSENEMSAKAAPPVTPPKQTTPATRQTQTKAAGKPNMSQPPAQYDDDLPF